MTVAEFLRWDSGDTTLFQLVDGQPVAMAPASFVHGYLQGELSRLIGNHLRARGSACDVIVNPGVVPKFLSTHNFLVPDLGVTCVPVRPGAVMIEDPVLLVEILSPSNRLQTWQNVRSYVSMPSMLDILVLRSDRVTAELLHRQADGSWPDEPSLHLRGSLTLDSIGFELDLAQLYARTGL